MSATCLQSRLQPKVEFRLLKGPFLLTIKLFLDDSLLFLQLVSPLLPLPLCSAPLSHYALLIFPLSQLQAPDNTLNTFLPDMHAAPTYMYQSQ